MESEKIGSIAALDEYLEERHLQGELWNPSAKSALQPFLWRWADIEPGLFKAAELVPMSMVPMRTVAPRNPSHPAGRGSLYLDVQILMPGERTKAHRNVKAETRFVLQAPTGAFFIIEGEPFPMEEGDLIITPNWTWHDHYNGGTEPAIWLDGLDMGIVELASQINEPHVLEHQSVTKPEGYSTLLYGHARPTWIASDLPTPPYRYSWKDTWATLEGLKKLETEADPWDGIRLLYAHPVHGGPTVPTMASEIQLLTPGRRTRRHRHNSSTTYHAFRGRGVTRVGDERLEWEQGDIFFVPAWAWHSHENASRDDALLYSISDWPATRALGLYREESD